MNYIELFDSISPKQMAEKITRSSRKHINDEQSLFRRNQHVSKLIISNLQEITEAAISKPLLIEHLINHNVSGIRYLDDIAAYDQHPLILLTT